MTARDVAVDQCSKPLHPTVWLEVSYWGTEPPTALFEDLDMIGWRPPVPAAPPASAIDWDAPDATTGERFTIRPWRVEGAVVQPPRGSGPRGHWSEADRDAFLLPLQGVLRRHGVAGPPAPPQGPDAAAPDATAPVHEGGAAVVRAELPPAVDRAAIAAALAPLGVAAHIATESKAITTTYRGTPFETQVTVVHAEALVDADRAPVVAAVLRDLGLRPAIDAAGPEPAVDVREGDPTGPSVPAAGSARRTVWLAVEPALADRTRAGLATLAGMAADAVATEEATVVVTSTYRGTPFETRRPAVRLTASVPAAPLDPLAALCRDLGLHIDDPSRVHVGPVEAVAPEAPRPDGARCG